MAPAESADFLLRWNELTMNKNINHIIPIKSEYDSLIEEIQSLRMEIVRLTALRDDLLLRICPALRAAYEEKIGSIEREILAATMYLREKQRILEILRAQLNRQETVSYEEAERTAGEEKKEFEEDLKQKSKEAENSRKKWEETAWSDFTEDAFAEDDFKDDNSGENGAEEGDSFEGHNTNPEDEDHTNSRNEDEYHSDDDVDQEETRRPKKKRSLAQKIKSLYRKIVKRLHPDANPNITDHEKELFNEAQKAYQEGDYETLKRIWQEISGLNNPGEIYADTPEDLEKLRALRKQLRVLLAALQSEIAGIRGEFPYTMKALLENEQLLTARQEELRQQLKEIREADAQMAAFIEKVKEEINRQKGACHE